MALSVKGLTVEIGGDTTKLESALGKCTNTAKSLQTELNFVNKALKLDPHNTELVAQKQTLLKESIENTKTKLDALRQAQEQADQMIQEGVEVDQEEYRKLQREIVFAEERLKSMIAESSNLGLMSARLTELGTKLEGIGNKMQGVGRSMTMYLTTPILGVGTAAVTIAADFDSAMSQVSAVSGATGQDLQDLRDKAREMGAQTKFSATEAADAFNYMAMAGWKTEDMLNGIEGIMNLAAASGEDLATTSDIVTDALTAFGLSAQDAGHFADILAAASSNANTNVSMMGETFKYVAPIAGAMGYSAEDTAEAIGLMANAGIKSSQAGTALRKILTELNGEIEISGEALGDVVVQTTNADGTMRDLNDILADCRAAFSQLSESEQAATAESLVGKTAMSGFLAIMNAAPEDIEKLNNAIATCSDEVDGYSGQAEKMAAVMQDNLGGQITILKSQLQELAISFGELLMPKIREIVGKIQEFVDKLNSMDDSQKAMILRIAAIVAAIGPLLLGLGKVVSTVGTCLKVAGTFSGWLAKISAAAEVAGTSIGAVAAPVAAVIAVIVALVAAFKHLWDTNEEFRTAIIGIWEGIKEKFNSFTQGIVDRLNALGFDFENITEVLSALWEGFCGLLAPVFEGAFSIISSVLGTVLDVLIGLLDFFIGLFTGNWDQCWLGIQEIFVGIWDGIVGIFTAVCDTLEGILDEVCSWFGTTWEETYTAIFDFFVGIWDSIVTFFTETIANIVSAIGQWVVDMVNKAVELGQNFLSSIVSFFQELPYKIGYFIGYALASVVQWVINMVAKAREMGTNFLAEIVSFFQQLPGRILTFITNAINNVITWRNNMIAKAKEVGTQFLQNVVSFFQQLPEKLWTCLVNAANKIIQWKNDLIQKGRDAINGLKDAVVNAANEIPGKMLEIGQNIVNGVWNGIQNAKDAFVSNVKSFFGGIVDGAKSALGIASPSKVMAREVGRFIPQGVAVGVEEDEDEMEDSMIGSIRRSVSRTADAARGLISSMFEGVQTPTLTPAFAGGYGDYNGGTTIYNIENKVEIHADTVDTAHAEEIADEINRLLGDKY